MQGFATENRQTPSARDGRSVSEFSIWTDTVWKFTNPTAGGNDIALWWNFPVAGGERLTDPRHEGLLHQARSFIWSVGVASERGRNPKITTFPSLMWALRRLISWMVCNGYDRFSQLKPKVCLLFVETMADKYETNGGLTDYTIAGLADVVCRIYEQAPRLSHVPAAVISKHPFDNETGYCVGLKIAGKRTRGFIPPVPEEIFLASVRTAIEWIDRRAVDAIDLQNIFIDQMRKYNRSRSNSFYYNINQELSQYEFTSGGSLATPWRKGLSAVNATTELRALVADARDAALLCLEALVGLRISEVCGIVAGDIKGDAEWPSCIEAERSQNGCQELFFLKGRVFKGEREHRDDCWLIGSRPVGSTYLPPAVRSVNVLWKLMEPWRKSSGRVELIITIPKAFPKRGEGIGRPRGKALARSQASWIVTHVELPDECRGWHVTVHQWRKSFAMYMIRSNSKLAPAVRDHFKHISTVILERGYIGHDVEMLGLIEDEATYAAAEFMFSSLNGEPVAGKVAQHIAESHDALKRHIGPDKTARESVEILAATLSEDRLRMWPSDWGKCFFRSEVARCHRSVEHGFENRADRPDFAMRRPDVCCDCVNLLVFNDDIEFWTSRLMTSLAVADANRAAGESGMTIIAEQRAEACRKILRKFGVTDVNDNWSTARPEPEHRMS